MRESEHRHCRLCCPADSVNEKNTRGRVKSAVERHISRKGVAIVDSLNNIKGYRHAPTWK